MTSSKKLALCLPLYGRQVDVGTAQRFFLSGSRDVEVNRFVSQSSLLAYGFNKQWLVALAGGYDYFLMLHGDVEPVDVDWIDTMLGEMARCRADVLGTVIPIKELGAGVTSTAIGEVQNKWHRKRLTLQQVSQLPETFCSADIDTPEKPLLVNTGCLLVKLSKPWVHRVRFEIETRIVDGDAECLPEDWYFSRQAWENGARVFATRKVRVVHHGDYGFKSFAINNYAASEVRHG